MITQPIGVLIVRPEQNPDLSIIEGDILGIAKELNRPSQNRFSAKTFDELLAEIEGRTLDKVSIKHAPQVLHVDDDLILYYLDDKGTSGLPLNRIIDGKAYYGNLLLVCKNEDTGYDTLPDEAIDTYYQVFSKKEISREEIPYLLYRWFDENPGSFERYLRQRREQWQAELERKKREEQPSFISIEFDDW